MQTKQTLQIPPNQYVEVDEKNQTNLDQEKLNYLLQSEFGSRIGEFQSSVGFYYGIYVREGKTHPVARILDFVHIVGGPRKDGYVRYANIRFILFKDGHISSVSIMQTQHSDGSVYQEPSATALKDLIKMVEIALKYLNL